MPFILLANTKFLIILTLFTIYLAKGGIGWDEEEDLE